MSIQMSLEKKKQFCSYLDLYASVINGTTPDEVPENFNWKFFCKHAQRNSVLNILSYAIDKLNNKPDETIIKVAENERRYSIIKETSQLIEVENILQEFEKSEIRNIPLKGYFMKHLYPQSDFRTMTDVDILVDKNKFKDIRSIFEKLQYSNADVIKSDEIHFHKDLTYFEIHSDLNCENDTFFKNIWNKAVKRDDYDFSYSLTNEDFYIYMVYHCAKHFQNGGLGIRMLMDIYVFLSTHKDLDKNYIQCALKELKIFDFEKCLRDTSLNWFSDEATEITPFGEFVLYCSTFGESNVFFYQDHLNIGSNYWLKQIFIPYSKMKSRYAYLEKAPILLPFSWVQYWFTRIFLKRNLKLKQGLQGRAGANISEEDKKFVEKLMKQVNM